jgi:hypothetical protein
MRVRTVVAVTFCALGFLAIPVSAARPQASGPYFHHVTFRLSARAMHLGAHRFRLWVSMKQGKRGVAGATAGFRLARGRTVRAGRTNWSGIATTVISVSSARGSARLGYRGRHYVIALGAKKDVSGDPILILDPSVVFPEGVTTVSGSGFNAYEPILIYVDSTPVVNTIADGPLLDPTTVAVPATDVAAIHIVTAVGGQNADGGTAQLQVYTEWDGARGDQDEVPGTDVGSLGTRDAVNELNMSADRMAGGKWQQVLSPQTAQYGPCTDVTWAQSGQGLAGCGTATLSLTDLLGGLGTLPTFGFACPTPGLSNYAPLEYGGFGPNGVTIASNYDHPTIYSAGSCSTVSGFPLGGTYYGSPAVVMQDPSAGEDTVFAQSGGHATLYASCFTGCSGATAQGTEPAGWPISNLSFCSASTIPLVVGTGSSTAIYVGDLCGSLYAFNNAGNALPGFTTVSTTGSFQGLASPVYHAGRIFFGASNDKFYSVNAATGAVVWDGVYRRRDWRYARYRQRRRV